MQTSTASKAPASTKALSQSKDLEARESMATIGDDDERLLAEIGYEQVRVLLPKSLDLVV